MRCTRCDRLAIPQAVGHLPDGRVVFGWCLDCLAEVNCTGIEVARRGRSVALDLAGSKRAAPEPRPAGSERRRTVTLVVCLLAAWSLILVATGTWLSAARGRAKTSPLGNGTPALLLAGGGATASLGLVLACLTLGPAFVRSPIALRSFRWATFALALAILLAGVVFHTPQRAPFAAATAIFVLGLSALARRQEARLEHSAVLSPGILTDDPGPSLSYESGDPGY